MLPNCSCGCGVVVVANTIPLARAVLSSHPELDASTAMLCSPRSWRSMDGRRVDWIVDAVDLAELPTGWRSAYHKLLMILHRNALKTHHA